jgi:hypothetical protein
MFAGRIFGDDGMNYVVSHNGWYAAIAMRPDPGAA